MILKASVNEIDFEVKSASAQGATVEVALIAVNRSTDRNVDIFRLGQSNSISLYDERGTPARAGQTRIANVSSDYAIVRTMLVSGIPTPVVLTFTVPTVGGRAQLTRIVRLDLPVVIDGPARFSGSRLQPLIDPEGVQHLIFRNLTVNHN